MVSLRFLYDVSNDKEKFQLKLWMTIIYLSFKDKTRVIFFFFDGQRIYIKTKVKRVYLHRRIPLISRSFTERVIFLLMIRYEG